MEILDFSRDLDLDALDGVVAAMYTGTGPAQPAAQVVLAQFQEHPDAWQRVPAILQQSARSETKYLALQILDRLISTRWKTLPADQQQGIRNFIVETIISESSDESNLRRQKTYINKLDMTLIEILKQEWPHNWPNFISEIVASSKASLPICENNMAILRLLSEEVFDFSAEKMTYAKTDTLKRQMCAEFSEVFMLCSEVLEKAQKPSLIKATLETTLRFLSWMPIGFIFETTIIDTLLTRFLEVPEFRNITLKCLSEVAALSIPEYEPKFLVLFEVVMGAITRMIPPSVDLAEAYPDSSDEEQEMTLNLALFLCNFLSLHLHAVEQDKQHWELLLSAHAYLIQITRVPEKEVFRICLEYWIKFVRQLFTEEVRVDGFYPMVVNGRYVITGNGLGTGNPVNGGPPLRKYGYASVLSNLRLVMIERMAKPEEVLIVENEEGEIVREFMKESDALVIYKNMREILVYLTHLDMLDTENIMTEKLARQVDGSEWGWNQLNTLCWAIGSISGAMSEETETRFLVTVIKDLLGLCEKKRGKDNKAVVASNIMYIVGQYPRFLKTHWKFLKTVVNKNFEFMHETHEGVQDMACDTFLKIAQKCRRHFVMFQAGEPEPFIDEVLRVLPATTADLSPQQVCTFYEAVGYMISAQPNKAAQRAWLFSLMQVPNTAWDEIVAEANASVPVFENDQQLKVLANVLKTNVAACSSAGGAFLPQIERNHAATLEVYKAVSGLISLKVTNDGLIATKTVHVRQLRTIKKEILHLIETFVMRTTDQEYVHVNVIPTLLDAILIDYRDNVPAAREAEVLNTMATIVTYLGPLLNDQVPPMLEAVFGPTLSMISMDFSEFPEHRVGFFRLLRAINVKCFPALLGLSQEQFRLTMDSIMWAIKHTMRDISEVGLTILYDLLRNVVTKADAAFATAFYQTYLLAIIQDMFAVMTDTEHKSGFKLQCAVLARIFELVETNGVEAPLWAPSEPADPGATNQLYIRQYTAQLLTNAFPNVQPAYIEDFVTKLGQQAGDVNKYRTLVRDFLITSREQSGTTSDNADLLEEDKEAKARAEREEAAQIPGMLKPSQLKDEDEEL